MTTLNLKLSEDGTHKPWSVDTETLNVNVGGGGTAVLLGFSKTDEAATVILSCANWIADPSKADGMHPVIHSSAGDGVLSIPVLATIREDGSE